MTELHGEKIDIVDYSEDSAEFVANALSPARVSRVNIVDADARLAQVIVPDYQLSLAIGKEGQNARLAHKLTGWKIDIHSDNPGGNDNAGRRPAGDHAGGHGTDRGGRPGGGNADPRTGRGTSDAPAR
jgi:N utilization substance protein A